MRLLIKARSLESIAGEVTKQEKGSILFNNVLVINSNIPAFPTIPNHEEGGQST